MLSGKYTVPARDLSPRGYLASRRHTGIRVQYRRHTTTIIPIHVTRVVWHKTILLLFFCSAFDREIDEPAAPQLCTSRSRRAAPHREIASRHFAALSTTSITSIPRVRPVSVKTGNPMDRSRRTRNRCLRAAAKYSCSENQRRFSSLNAAVWNIKKIIYFTPRIDSCAFPCLRGPARTVGLHCGRGYTAGYWRIIRNIFFRIDYYVQSRIKDQRRSGAIFTHLVPTTSNQWAIKRTYISCDILSYMIMWNNLIKTQ